MDEFILRRNDVLICEGGEPGRAAVWDERETDIYFVRALYLDAQSGRLEKFFTGMTIKHLTGRGLAQYSFPLPPLSEKHRIVQRVDELFAICASLATQLAAGTQTRRRHPNSPVPSRGIAAGSSGAHLAESLRAYFCRLPNANIVNIMKSGVRCAQR